MTRIPFRHGAALLAMAGLCTALTACGGGGGGQTTIDDGGGGEEIVISRSSFDLSGASAPGQLATPEQAAGAASALFGVSGITTSLASGLSASGSAAASMRSIAKAAVTQDCEAGGTATIDNPSGSEQLIVTFDECVFETQNGIDGRLELDCEDLNSEGCGHVEAVAIGTASENLLATTPGSGELPPSAVTLLGSYSYPRSAPSGSLDVTAQLYVLDASGQPTQTTGFTLDLSFVSTEQAAGTVTQEYLDGSTIGVGSAGLALQCGSGRYELSTPEVLSFDSDGKLTSGTLLLESGNGAATVQIIEGDQASISLNGGTPVTMPLQQLLDLCGTAVN